MKELYFIVRRYCLGEQGHEAGSTREQVQELLKSAESSDDVVVIKGVLLEPVLQILPED